jgi:hypothetical protein
MSEIGSFYLVNSHETDMFDLREVFHIPSTDSDWRLGHFLSELFALAGDTIQGGARLSTVV